MQAYLEGTPIEENSLFDIGVPHVEVLLKRKYINFSEMSGVKSLYDFFSNKLYPRRSLQDNMIKFPIIEKLGYFEHTNKPSWKDFKESFIPNIVFRYKLFVYNKKPLIFLHPMTIEESYDVDRNDIINY